VPTKHLTPDEIVEQHFPYDGPHSAHTMADAADVIAGLVRYLNNAGWSVRLDGPSLHRVLSGLSLALQRTDQLLAQMGNAAEALADDPTLYDTRPLILGADTVTAVADALTEARQSIGFRLAIEQAAQQASNLGHGREVAA
jgi:hypothetical protein